MTRRLVFVAAILFAINLSGRVAAQAPLPARTDISRLGNAEQGKGLSVAFRWAATRFHPAICVIDNASPLVHEMRFQVLPQSLQEIAGLAGPGWRNARNLMLLGWLLMMVFLAVGMRGWYLERRARRQIGSLAYVEQRRSRILEDINHSKPLAEILERITELVSVRLSGAPCWCQITDGALLGNRPADLTSNSLRTAEHPIASRSGPPLGAIFAAFHTNSEPNSAEKEALEMAAGLATLAIETSRLYSELVHRSEFDLLTDVANRFAMGKALDATIQDARQSAGIFGLIYIDLNEFKRVNDGYGHQAGDMFLQETARRMKNQLRPGDTLARLGGDEFAVLVSRVHNRAQVQEIATRLEGCFDEPFTGEGYELYGSASVGIALYPEDADSADALLSSADAAMYAAKYARVGKIAASQAQLDETYTPQLSIIHGEQRKGPACAGPHGQPTTNVVIR